MEKCFDDIKSENKALRLELKEKCKALNECLNENTAIKVSMNEKKKYINPMHGNRNSKKKHAYLTCYECGRKGHIAFYCSYKEKHSPFKSVY